VKKKSADALWNLLIIAGVQDAYRYLNGAASLHPIFSALVQRSCEFAVPVKTCTTKSWANCSP
jgi:hypothetical protein